jgi:hypothetical protein
LVRQKLIDNLVRSFGPATVQVSEDIVKDAGNFAERFKPWQEGRSSDPFSVLHVPDVTRDTPVTAYTLLQSSHGNWNFSFQDFFRRRRTFWKRLFFDPAASLAFAETDLTGESPEASVSAKADDLPDNPTVETIRLWGKSETLKLVDSPSVRVVECRSFLSAGTAAILMTSVRQRLFLKSTRLCKLNRMACSA